MPKVRCNHAPEADRRRALELLASCRVGCTESLLVRAHGFAIPLLVELIRAGLASATTERVVAGPRAA
jgi:hypothetical protein